MADEVPQWFRSAVTDGMQMLVTLSLPGTPPVDTIDKTQHVWFRVLWAAPAQWNEALDRRRIGAAFMMLARSIERWPAPRQILEAMPPRPQARVLAAPPLSPEAAQRNRGFLRRLLGTMTTPQDHSAHVRTWLLHQYQKVER